MSAALVTSRLAKLSLLVAVTSIFLSCQAQQQAEAYAVHGIVEDRLTNQPIARALVEEQSSGQALLTDNEGRFEMNLPAGTATFTARRPGYKLIAQPTTVVINAATVESKLYLTPQAVITGHVELSTGEPAEGIQIQVYRSQLHKGTRSWQPSGMAQTNSEGNFRIADLPAPASYLLLSAAFPDLDLQANSRSAQSGYPAVYYPAGAEQASSGGLSLTPGQQATSDFVLTRERFYPVLIKVEGSIDGRALSFELHDENGRGNFPARFDQHKGNLEADLPSGRYSAEVRAQEKTNSYGRIDFNVPADSKSGLKLALAPLLPISVRIHRDASTFSNPSSVQTGGAVERDPGLSLSLEPFDGSSGGSGNLQRMPGSADNSLMQLDGVQPGRYWVRASPYEGYISAINSGGSDLANTPLVVGDGSATTAIDVTLRNDGGQIGGHVGGENTSSGSTVFIYAIAQFNAVVPFAQSNSQIPGDFTIASLAPGTYCAMALDEQVDLDVLPSDLLDRFKSKCSIVDVEAKGSSVVTLEVIDAEAELSGSGAAEPR